MLPLSPEQAHASFAPLAYCADQRGFGTTTFDDRLMIVVERGAWINFEIQSTTNRYVMNVSANKPILPEDQGPMLDTLKTIGDEIYACAMTHPPFAMRVVDVTPQPPAPPAPPAPPPQELVPTVTSSAMSNCERLVSCFAELAQGLCEHGDSDCSASFEIEISGNDEEACRDLFDSIPEIIQPFMMLRPDYTKPAVCVLK